MKNVQYAYKNYSDKEKREKIEKIKASELQALVSQGHFSEGDMLPKIQACISFVKQTGKRAIITDIEHAAEAIDDSISSAGTIVVADEHM
jgi:carbamate kinase